MHFDGTVRAESELTQARGSLSARVPRQAACLRQSELVTHTSRNVPKEEVSINAQLLTRAGFVNRLMAGVYSYLPLGARVLAKIENVVREECNAFGSQEVMMPALQPKEAWTRTGRWDTVDVLFKLKGVGNRDLALGPTHEEVVTPLIGQFLLSHRDLPASVYQIQTKFRNEARAKSGILRGREFRMKDMYSFHAEETELTKYYDTCIELYNRIFARCGVGHCTYPTLSGGGIFTTGFSHEFQTVTPYGEDTIWVCRERGLAVNVEVFDKVKELPEWRDAKLETVKAIEVGNIYRLGVKYTEPCGVTFNGADGKSHPVFMGCYGLGTTRLLGAVVEVLHDEKGMKWPAEIAPYRAHLVSLFNETNDEVEALYQYMGRAGVETLYDDRPCGAGEKLKDCDLIGVPLRIVIGPRSLKEGHVEVSERGDPEVKRMTLDQVRDFITR